MYDVLTRVRLPSLFVCLRSVVPTPLCRPRSPPLASRAVSSSSRCPPPPRTALASTSSPLAPLPPLALALALARAAISAAIDNPATRPSSRRGVGTLFAAAPEPRRCPPPPRALSPPPRAPSPSPSRRPPSPPHSTSPPRGRPPGADWEPSMPLRWSPVLVHRLCCGSATLPRARPWLPDASPTRPSKPS